MDDFPVPGVAWLGGFLALTEEADGFPALAGVAAEAFFVRYPAGFTGLDEDGLDGFSALTGAAANPLRRRSASRASSSMRRRRSSSSREGPCTALLCLFPVFADCLPARPFPALLITPPPVADPRVRRPAVRSAALPRAAAPLSAVTPHHRDGCAGSTT
ncbi:hypothetical protein [Streptomyces werraensis]|uniref:hypothetical protein n=1 Tax=Streptomyces werraensis TaxID=68284 RepID=UPI003426FF93